MYRLGESLPEVICDECTAAQHPNENGERLGVWVRATDPAKEQRAIRKAKEKKAKPTKPKRQPAPWEVWLTND